MKKFYIVASGNEKVGLGHIKRSLIIAECLRDHGVNDICFLNMDNSQKALALIKSSGFNIENLQSNKESEENLLNYLSKHADSFILFDTDEQLYREEMFQDKLHELGVKFMHITVDAKGFFKSQLVLNQNIIAHTLNYTCSHETKLLLGPTYFIFPKQFKISKRSAIEGNHLMVLFGNADPSSVTPKVIKVLPSLEHLFDSIIIVVGGLNQDFEQIKQEVQHLPKAKIIYNENNLNPYFGQVNFAITSMGLGFWELAANHVNCLTISASQREMPTQELMHEKGYSYSLGTYSDKDYKSRWFQKISAYFENNLFTEYSTTKLAEKINPNGVENVAKEIIKLL